MNFAGVLPLLQADWQLSNAQAGAIQSAGQFGYLIAVLILSSLTDYIDAKKLIVTGGLWAGIGNLLFAGFAHDMASAILIRGLLGLGIAGIYMPGVKLISRKITPSQRGRAVGLFVASFTLGTAVSIALSGNLASLLGWRLAVGLTSIGPLLGASISWRYLPPSGRPDRPGQRPRPINELLHNRPALLIMLLYVCHAWEVLGIRSWLTAFLASVRTHSGASLAEATSSGATIAGLATLLAATATASIGALSDRLNRLNVIIAVMALSTLFTLVLGFSLTLPWIVVIGISLLAAFLSNADSAVISTQLTEVVPDDYLGRTLAIYSFLGFAAGSVSPMLFGATLDYATSLAGQQPGIAWGWAFATFALGSLLGLAIAVRIKRRPVPVGRKPGAGR